jgi:hypothetical protein
MSKTFPIERLQKTKELFPRIVDNLELFWGYPEFEAYLNSLTSETRETKRQGFPKEVAEELLELQMGGLGRDDNWTVY